MAKRVEPKLGPRRATLTRAGSADTRRKLVRAAVTLWRVNGYVDTTVAEICKAAGVSKGLFYFYFARKEDVLQEIGVLSAASARAEGRRLMDADMPLPAIVQGVLSFFGQAIRHNPPALVRAAIEEGYRSETGLPNSEQLIFLDIFASAARRGEIPRDADYYRAAQMAQGIVTNVARAWAVGALGSAEFEDEAQARMELLLRGLRAAPSEN